MTQPPPAVPPSPAVSPGLAFTLTRHFSNLLAGLMEDAPACGPSCSIISHHWGGGGVSPPSLGPGNGFDTAPPPPPESKVRKITLHNSLSCIPENFSSLSIKKGKTGITMTFFFNRRKMRGTTGQSHLQVTCKTNLTFPSKAQVIPG